MRNLVGRAVRVWALNLERCLSFQSASWKEAHSWQLRWIGACWGAFCSRAGWALCRAARSSGRSARRRRSGWLWSWLDWRVSYFDLACHRRCQDWAMGPLCQSISDALIRLLERMSPELRYPYSFEALSPNLLRSYEGERSLTSGGTLACSPKYSTDHPY